MKEIVSNILDWIRTFLMESGAGLDPEIVEAFCKEYEELNQYKY